MRTAYDFRDHLSESPLPAYPSPYHCQFTVEERSFTEVTQLRTVPRTATGCLELESFYSATIVNWSQRIQLDGRQWNTWQSLVSFFEGETSFTSFQYLFVKCREAWERMRDQENMSWNCRNYYWTFHSTPIYWVSTKCASAYNAKDPGSIPG